MSATYTPGPWLADDPFADDDDIQTIVIGPGPEKRGATFCEESIAHVFDLNKSPEEFAANARLIAAAPDLLAVAKLMLSVDDEWKALSLDERTRVEAAISKATTGEAP